VLCGRHCSAWSTLHDDLTLHDRSGARTRQTTRPATASTARSSRRTPSHGGHAAGCGPAPRYHRSVRREACPAAADASPMPSIPSTGPKTGVAQETRAARPTIWPTTFCASMCEKQPCLKSPEYAGAEADRDAVRHGRHRPNAKMAGGVPRPANASRGPHLRGDDAQAECSCRCCS